MKRKLFLLLLIISLITFSCTKKENIKSDTELNIVASFYPIYISLLNITQGATDTFVSLLAPADSGCLHNYQLTTKDMSLIESCSFLFINGAGMEDFILESTTDDQKAKIIDSSSGWLELDHNSHIWISLDGTIYQIEKIAQELAKIDPKNAQIYSSNKTEYIKKLRNLKNQFAELKNKLTDTNIVLFNDSFYYLVKELNLKVLNIAHQDHGQEPSARDLANISNKISETLAAGKKIILLDTMDSSNTSAKIISQETNLPIYELDPGTSGPLEPDAYISTMEYNLKTLEKAADL